MPPRRAPQQGRVGDQRALDLLFRDTLLCVTGPHRIAALSARICDCKHTLRCRSRAGTTLELRCCAAGCLRTYAHCCHKALLYCSASYLHATDARKASTLPPAPRPAPAVTSRPRPLIADTVLTRLDGRADSSVSFLVSFGEGRFRPLISRSLPCSILFKFSRGSISLSVSNQPAGRGPGYRSVLDGGEPRFPEAHDAPRGLPCGLEASILCYFRVLGFLVVLNCEAILVDP